MPRRKNFWRAVEFLLSILNFVVNILYRTQQVCIVTNRTMYKKETCEREYSQASFL
jgi:hypothetical protein